MIATGLKKYFVNPSLGISVSILYIVVLGVTSNVELALISSMVFAALCDAILRFYTKSKVSSMLFLLTFCALALTLISWLFLRSRGVQGKAIIAFFEIFMVVLLVVSQLSKTYISLYVGKRLTATQKTMFGEFFDIARLLQYIFTLHLFIILIYKYLKGQNPIDAHQYYWSDILIGLALPGLLLIALLLFELIKTRSVVKQLRCEEWLPIVNESGEVTGRIAKSVSLGMKNKFMHPVIRIAVVHDGQVYLQQRDNNDILDHGCYDHPFEKYMQFNHEINLSVRNCISSRIKNEELEFSFLIKYVFENADTKRLIFLFVSRVETEAQLNSINNNLKGKFWTTKQIEASMLDEKVFSECFQLEYEYLKNTVLFADMVRKDMNK